jgi:hypothetical protein
MPGLFHLTPNKKFENLKILSSTLLKERGV